MSVSWVGSKLVLNVRLIQSMNDVQGVRERLDQVHDLLDEQVAEDREEGDDRKEDREHDRAGGQSATPPSAGQPRDRRLHRDGDQPGQQQQEEEVLVPSKSQSK